MGTHVPAKRPFCPSCSKPARVCLCSRIKTPLLDNSIAVTILQHSQEKNHPLNSTRIATLGLKNLTIATVSDVHFEAQFFIRLLKSDFEQIPCYPEEKISALIAKHAECGFTGDLINGKSDFVGLEIPLNQLEKQNQDSDLVSTILTAKESIPNKQSAITHQNHLQKPIFYQIDQTQASEEPVISATVAKCGFTCSVTQLLSHQTQFEKPNFDQLLASQVGQDAISNGFVVKRLQKKQMKESKEFEEQEEFEIVVPPGSALLFPSKDSISLEAIDFEVKHLIVLDGTWRKAKRMYHENPWLKFLPHLKLNSNKLSLYSEVRQQPSAGCLSTIESILFAMKGLGHDQEGLDDLLDVFESMVGDQRRCKDENVSKLSPT
ncbi:DTW [Macleaya cordata]|uniref:tRNA-uridine aminocarboxypropyltransferase n=1 Tax=Macleaya cordata TaxID=56857 RepID=A0A200Q6P8_MACCD|nr:DTW [Macleaya cordata]